MSAFIVSPSLINALLCHIDKGKDGKDAACTFKDMGHDLDTRQGLQRLGEDLWALNHEAIHQRYGEPREPSKPFKFQPGKVLRSRVQILKDVRCLRYQCSEGDVYKTPLFEALSQFGDNVAFYLISETDEYRDGTWGA